MSITVGRRCWVIVALSIVAGWGHLPEVRGEDVASILREFSRHWPDDRIPYRTAEDTTTWKTYVLSMKRLVALGEAAVPELIAGCDDRSFQVRALCARVLGFLEAREAVPKLIKLLEDRPEVAVLAADALGQIQDAAGLAALRAARRRVRNGDVLLHVNKALERRVALEDDVREQILKISADSIDLAKLGQPAPDFTLRDPTGKPWTLSRFRGKKAVVLVFIYGDG
ncbi:MAG: redoxin domain-containing protein [Planctomycetes bacterium]|nr:redoxin domain-containing protein [Planctomycetota bacterium]